MSEGFTGTYHQKVDDKGRVSIPKHLRYVLEAGDPDFAPGASSRVYLVYGKHLDRALEGYTVTEFRHISQQIAGMKRTNPRRKVLQDFVIRSSLVLEVDSNGRAILPKNLRDKLGVEDGAELVFGGLWDHFEVRRAEVHEAAVESSADAWLEEQGGPGIDIMGFLDEEEG